MITIFSRPFIETHSSKEKFPLNVRNLAWDQVMDLPADSCSDCCGQRSSKRSL